MQRIKQLWSWLTEPFEVLSQSGDHRRATTTATFFLFAIISVTVERWMAGNTSIGTLVLLVAGYFLSRTRWFKFAALILIFTLTFPSYLVALRLPNPDPSRFFSAFGWVILPLLLSSLIYTVPTTIAISAINLLALTILSFIRPELNFRVIGGAFGFYGFTSAILIIVIHQRDQIEKDRQKELVISQEKLSQEVIERERFAEQAQRRAQELAMLNEVSTAISSLMELDNIFNLIYEQIQHHFQLDVFFIALYDEKSNRLSFPLTADNGKLWNEPDKELSESLRVAQVIQTGKPLLWNRTSAEIQEAMQSGNRVGDPSRVAASILINPLQIGSRTIGVISVQSYAANSYNLDHLILLSALAHQIVVAIENARLFKETKQNAQQLSILNEVGQAVAALKDLPELLEVVFQQANQYLNIDTFYVGLYDAEKEEVGYPFLYDEGQRYNLNSDKLSSESYLYRLLHGEKAKLINRAPEELAILTTNTGMLGNTSRLSASLMIVPLALGNQIIGIISAQSYTMNAYDEDDLNLFIRIANQVSIAIENSRLYTAAQEEIAERQKIEAQLRAAEAKYRELVESVPAVIYSSESGATGRWFYVSPQIENLLGFTPQEWLADPNLWYQQIHPEDQEYATSTETALLTKGEKLETEYRMFTKNGQILWIHDESINVSRSDNQAYIVQGILTDISIRKQAELTLKDSEEKYHALFIRAERQAQELSLLNQVQNALANELDFSDLVRTVVEAIANAFGYIFVSLYKLENGFLQLQHQVGYETVIERISPSEGVSGKVVSSGQALLIQDVNQESEFLRASPHIKSEICVPLFDGDEIFGTLNVESSQEYQLTEDDLRLMKVLSEQINIAIRRAQLYDDRAEGLRREKHINEFAHAISSTLDLPSILEIVARLSVELIGADTGNVSLMSDDGIEMTNVYSYNEDPSLGEIIAKGQGLTWLTYEKGRPVICDEYAQHPNAMPDWSATGLHAFMSVPVMSGEKKLGALTLYNRTPEKKFTQRDVSLIEALAQEVAVAIQNARLFNALQKELAEHKQTQDKLQILVHELEAKNAELERFTYSVSHDLKSPLVTIGGFLGFLESDIKKGEIHRTENTIRRIRDAAKKMQRLLDELLELSRVGRLINPPIEIPFGELVGEALELAHGQLTERQVQVKIEAELPIVNVDRVRMVEVLQNLIVNAVKFMGNREDPTIEIGMQVINGEKTFFVKDNGIGIAPDYHSKVFGLFDKLDANSDGTGIGLALVKRIVEVHGGTIWIESESGKGATFFFTLESKKA